MNKSEPDSSCLLREVEIEGPILDWSEELSALRQRLVTALRRRRIDPDLSEDVVQEALWRIWIHRDRLRDQRSLMAWSSVVLRNALRSAVTKRPPVAPLASDPLSLSEDALKSALRSEFRNWVETELDGLSPRQRAAVLGRHLRQEAAHETSAQLGITPECLKRVLYRGLSRLRERAQEDGMGELVGLLDAQR